MPADISQHLIQSVKNGDQKAFGLLIDQCGQFVYALTLKMTGNADDARDVAQECFVKVWQNIKSYDSNYKFNTWLYKVAMNASLDKLRKNTRERKVFSSHDEWHNPLALSTLDPSKMFEEKQLMEFLRLISGKLSAKQQSVFVLHDLDDFSQEEISAILDMPKNSVKSNLFHARKAIRQMLKWIENIKTTKHEM
jgi:RNA polymerase sigma-70 factor, ECF subfamily